MDKIGDAVRLMMLRGDCTQEVDMLQEGFETIASNALREGLEIAKESKAEGMKVGTMIGVVGTVVTLKIFNII